MSTSAVIKHEVTETKVDIQFPYDLYVGDVLKIHDHIGSYAPGDLFFVHATDDLEVSDCGIIGTDAKTGDETVLDPSDFLLGWVVTKIDDSIAGLLWDLMTDNLQNLE